MNLLSQFLGGPKAGPSNPASNTSTAVLSTKKEGVSSKNPEDISEIKPQDRARGEEMAVKDPAIEAAKNSLNPDQAALKNKLVLEIMTTLENKVPAIVAAALAQQNNEAKASQAQIEPAAINVKAEPVQAEANKAEPSPKNNLLSLLTNPFSGGELSGVDALKSPEMKNIINSIKENPEALAPVLALLMGNTDKANTAPAAA